MENFKKGFIEFNFCKECKSYIECVNSEFGIELLEKVMILKALSKDEGSVVQKKLDLIINSLEINKDKLENFVKERKKDCIYFN